MQPVFVVADITRSERSLVVSCDYSRCVSALSLPVHTSTQDLVQNAWPINRYVRPLWSSDSLPEITVSIPSCLLR